MTTTPDGRLVPPPLAGEREMLETWLDFQRGTLRTKCAGLDERQVRIASAEPSAMTVLGLVRHVAMVERRWFQNTWAGLDVPFLHSRENDLGFALDPDQTMDEALAVWDAEIARGRELIADAALDDTCSVLARDAALLGGDKLNLRWILVHLIEEYARHNGHADLLRERIDGVTGM